MELWLIAERMSEDFWLARSYRFPLRICHESLRSSGSLRLDNYLYHLIIQPTFLGCELDI